MTHTIWHLVCSSYLKIFYNYVFDPEMGPFARVTRDSPKGDGKMTPIPYEWLTGQHEVRSVFSC